MFNKKGTKRSLLMSGLALLLCISLLVGSTFAWFTDSVVSGGNIIKSGTLEVSMMWAYGKENPETTTWKNAEDGAIFNYDKWEPGYTEARHIAVKNEGTLALKYQLTIVPEDEVSELADVIDVYYIPVATQIADRADLSAYTPVGTLRDLIDNKIGAISVMPNGVLLKDEGFTATLVLKMQESAGNEYQNLSIGTSFSVQLLATQLTAEDDTYGPDYDEDAWMDGMQVFNANDLQAALNNGETNIILMDDIETAEPIVVPAAASTFSLRAAPVYTVINLNGKTLKSNSGTVIRNEGNLHLVGEGKIESTAAAYAIRVQTGNVIIESANVVGAFGAVSVFNGADVTINGGNFYAEGINGKTSHCIYVSGSTLTVNGGTFDCGYSSEGIDTICASNADVTLNDGDFYASELGAGFFLKGDVTVKGGNFQYAPTNNLGDGFKAEANEDGSFSVSFPQESVDSFIKDAVAGDIVNIPAGTYTFPASSLKEGVTVVCEEGAVFTGTSSLNIKGATVIGATFSNVGGQAVSGTINGTFENCTFIGAETLRWCYTTAGTTVVFENCVIKTTLRGVHFDEMNGDVIFRNCEINGFNAYSGTGNITFEGCTFGADASGYNGLNIYSNTTLEDCTFNFTSNKTNFIDMEGTGKTLTITNCTATLDGAAVDVMDFVGGSKLAQNTVNGAVIVSTAAELSAALANGQNVVLTADVMTNATTTAPYGNKVAFVQKGGTFDGGNNDIGLTIGGDHYLLMTSGGTIKNLNVVEGFRGIMIMYPNADVVIDNVNIKGEVCYTINTGEGDGTQDLIVTNSTIFGWTSIGNAVKTASFTDCTFGQGEYYTNVYGRLVKPYVDTVFENCEFGSQYYIDLSQLGKDGSGKVLTPDAKVVLKNCTVNGVKLTADNWQDLVAAEDDCGVGQISIEGKNGTYMTASNVFDYVIFE